MHQCLENLGPAEPTSKRQPPRIGQPEKWRSVCVDKVTPVRRHDWSAVPKQCVGAVICSHKDFTVEILKSGLLWARHDRAKQMPTRSCRAEAHNPHPALARIGWDTPNDTVRIFEFEEHVDVGSPLNSSSRTECELAHDVLSDRRSAYEPDRVGGAIADLVPREARRSPEARPWHCMPLPSRRCGSRSTMSRPSLRPAFDAITN
jgi:hypothetical protein